MFSSREEIQRSFPGLAELKDARLGNPTCELRNLADGKIRGRDEFDPDRLGQLKTTLALSNIDPSNDRDFRSLNEPGNFQRSTLHDVAISSAYVLLEGPVLIEMTSSFPNSRTAYAVTTEGALLVRDPTPFGSVSLIPLGEYQKAGTAIPMTLNRFDASVDPQNDQYTTSSLRYDRERHPSLSRLTTIEFTSDTGNIVRLYTPLNARIRSGHRSAVGEVRTAGFEHLAYEGRDPAKTVRDPERRIFEASKEKFGNADYHLMETIPRSGVLAAVQTEPELRAHFLCRDEQARAEVVAALQGRVRDFEREERNGELPPCTILSTPKLSVEQFHALLDDVSTRARNLEFSALGAGAR